MGFLNNMLNSLSKDIFGVQRPRDALRILENIIRSNRDDDEKVRHAKPILMWLKKLSLSADSKSREANEVLNEVRNRYADFLDINGINV